jgi:hypothetical protein
LLIGLFLTAGAAAPTAESGLRIHTELDPYEVTPGEAFDIRVYLDTEDGLPGDQKIPTGLFSYVVKLEYDPEKLALVGPDAIRVPDALNFNGFSAGASRQMGDGFAGVKGNIDQLRFEPYEESWIASFLREDISGGRAYEVKLSPRRSLGPSEQLFLDGVGKVLDARVQFATAQNVAVPEPSMAWMFLAVFGVSCLRVRRDRMHACRCSGSSSGAQSRTSAGRLGGCLKWLCTTECGGDPSRGVEAELVLTS